MPNIIHHNTQWTTVKMWLAWIADNKQQMNHRLTDYLGDKQDFKEPLLETSNSCLLLR